MERHYAKQGAIGTGRIAPTLKKTIERTRRIASANHTTCRHQQGVKEMATKKTPYKLVPQLGRLRDEVVFGDVWEQPELNKRDRSLITVALLTALYRTEELRGHIKRALDNGVTQDEIRGVITHLAFYAGWPTAVNAGRVAAEIFEDD